MTDLERFFCRLVETLSAIDPAHLQQPIPLAEIRGSIMPYRSNRRALHLDTSEDYELVLMRLCAGEGGFASINPDEARARFKLELASPNPDLHALRQFGEATLTLAPGWVAAAMAAAGDDTDRPAPDVAASFFEIPLPTNEPMSVAPATRNTANEPASAGRTETRPNAAPTSKATAGTGTATAMPTRCIGCDETLPDGGTVRFCPYCGTRQTPIRCADCGAGLETGWRFCAACGQAVT